MTTAPALAHLTALESLVREHLSLARRLALGYRGRGVELEELVSVANLALVKAAHGFDAEHGAFPPYAAATIRGDIKKYFRDHAWSVRPPRRVQELQAAITAVGADGAHRDVNELAGDLDVAPEDVVEAMAARGCFRSESTDREVGALGLTLGETLSFTDAGLELVDDWVTVGRLCRELSRDERDLLRMRFVEDLTQQEIADRLGISQMQVSRRLRAVLDGLRRQVLTEHEQPPEAA